MRPITWCESMSANQFTQAGHVSLNVRRAQEVFCSLPLRLITTSKPRQPKNRRCPHCSSTARTPALVLAHTHTHTPSVSVSPSSCPPCPAASSPSTGRRSRMGWCRTSGPPSRHPCRGSEEPHPVKVLLGMAEVLRLFTMGQN